MNTEKTIPIIISALFILMWALLTRYAVQWRRRGATIVAIMGMVYNTVLLILVLTTP